MTDTFIGLVNTRADSLSDVEGGFAHEDGSKVFLFFFFSYCLNEYRALCHFAHFAARS